MTMAGTVKMTSPEGTTYDIVPEGVKSLEVLGWNKVEAAKKPAADADKK